MNKKINIVGITGHRKLKHDYDIIKKNCKKYLNILQADVVITGMAIGFDMLVAEVCIEEDIPFVAAIPFIGQTNMWPINEKKKYINIMSKAYKYKIISSGKFANWKLLERNKWIVNRSNVLISYWDGIPKGGSYHCFEYARKQGIPRENIFEYCI